MRRCVVHYAATPRYVPDNRIQRYHPGERHARSDRGDRAAATLLQAEVRALPTTDILGTINRLREDGYHIADKTHLMALHLAAKTKGKDVFHKVMLRMAQNGMALYVAEAYNALMDLCVAMSRAELLPFIHTAMGRRDPPVRPDRVTYLILLRGYGKVAHDAWYVEDFEGRKRAHRGALAALAAAEQAGWTVDKQLATALLQSASPEEAVTIMQRLRARGVFPDMIMYSTVLKVMSVAAADPVRMWEVLKEMHHERITPDRRCWIAFLELCKRTHSLRPLVAAVRIMRETRVRMCVVCWTVVLQTLPPFIACGNVAALALAEDIFRYFADRGELNDMRKRYMAACLGALGNAHPTARDHFYHRHWSNKKVEPEPADACIGVKFAAAAAAEGVALEPDAIELSGDIAPRVVRARGGASPRKGGSLGVLTFEDTPRNIGRGRQ